MVFSNLIALVLLILLLAFFTSWSYLLLFLIIIFLSGYLFLICYYRVKIINHLVFCLFFVVVYFFCSKASIVDNNNSKSKFYQVKIITVKTNYFIVSNKYQYYLLNKYFYKNQTRQVISAEIDDTISCYATIEPLATSQNDQDFDFNTYLASNNINYHLVIVANNFIPTVNYKGTIRNKIIAYIKKMDPLITDYMLIFLFQRTTKNDISVLLNNYGIIALLTVSGIHINFLYCTINKLYGNKKSKLPFKIITFLILAFYLYLINFPIASVRAYVSLLILTVNKKLDRVNVTIFIAYLSLLFSPFQFYQLGWQLTFLLSLLIAMFVKKINKFKKHWQIFSFSALLSLFTVPIQLLINQGFSIFTIFYSIIFAPILLFYYLLLFFYLIMTIILPTFLLPLIKLMLAILILMLKSMALIDIWIPFFKPKIIMIYCYYFFCIILFLFAKYFNWKIWVIINLNLIFINLLIVFSSIKPYYQITVINVGNAMSILLTAPFQKSAILIDAGIAGNNPNSPIIVDYLRKEGIFKLDAIFLTHQHSDHINNLNYLKSKLAITAVYSNINAKLSYSIPFFSNIINYSYQLAPKNYSENNRSLVLCFNLFKYKFLVTGDIEAPLEKLLLKKRNLPQITFLQVAHHGSNSSTTAPFLAIVKPKVALISGVKTKLRQFPSQEVITRLQKFKIKTFWTGKNKTIHVQIYYNFFSIKTFN